MFGGLDFNHRISQIEEENCDVPRSDSAATVALDIDADRQGFGCTDEDLDSVEFVNLVSPEKADETIVPTTDNIIQESLGFSPRKQISPHRCYEINEDNKNTDNLGKTSNYISNMNYLV